MTQFLEGSTHGERVGGVAGVPAMSAHFSNLKVIDSFRFDDLWKQKMTFAIKQSQFFPLFMLLYFISATFLEPLTCKNIYIISKHIYPRVLASQGLQFTQKNI